MAEQSFVCLETQFAACGAIVNRKKADRNFRRSDSHLHRRGKCLTIPVNSWFETTSPRKHGSFLIDDEIPGPLVHVFDLLQLADIRARTSIAVSTMRLRKGEVRLHGAIKLRSADTVGRQLVSKFQKSWIVFPCVRALYE